jgi:hypothetical protein
MLARLGCVWAGLRHSPRAAVSPARDGIGSSTAAERSRPGAFSYRSASGIVRPHVAAPSPALFTRMSR